LVGPHFGASGACWECFQWHPGMWIKRCIGFWARFYLQVFNGLWFDMGPTLELEEKTKKFPSRTISQNNQVQESIWKLHHNMQYLPHQILITFSFLHLKPVWWCAH
jgi:hypothetical protein